MGGWSCDCSLGGMGLQFCQGSWTVACCKWGSVLLLPFEGCIQLCDHSVRVQLHWCSWYSLCIATQPKGQLIPLSDQCDKKKLKSRQKVLNECLPPNLLFLLSLWTATQTGALKWQHVACSFCKLWPLEEISYFQHVWLLEDFKGMTFGHKRWRRWKDTSAVLPARYRSCNSMA